MIQLACHWRNHFRPNHSLPLLSLCPCALSSFVFLHTRVVLSLIVCGNNNRVMLQFFMPVRIMRYLSLLCLKFFLAMARCLPLHFSAFTPCMPRHLDMPLRACTLQFLPFFLFSRKARFQTPQLPLLFCLKPPLVGFIGALDSCLSFTF